MVKIAVFADIHANYHALKAIIENINKYKYDEVFCLGDILSKGPNPKECMREIMNNNIEMIWGNHEGKAQELWAGLVDYEFEKMGNLTWCMDQMSEKEKEFIMGLKGEIHREYNGKKFLFTHYPFDKENKKYFFHRDLCKEVAEKYFADYNQDYIFFGHHHYHKFLKYKNKRLYNLGSSGCVEDDRTFYYVITISESRVIVRRKYLKYDREGLKNALVNSSTPNKSHLSKVFFGFNDL